MKSKKIKKFHRVIAIVFAMAFAFLPFSSFTNSRISSVNANAEDFTNVRPLDSLNNDISWLNPLSFFQFTIRRPTDNWSGTLNNESLNAYSFHLPQYISNVEFLNSNGVPTMNTVFNYLPLYSGSFRYSFNYNSDNKYGEFRAESFPSPVEDFTIEQLQNTLTTSTLKISCDNTLIPLKSFLALVESDLFNLSVKANFVSGSMSILQLDETEEPYQYKSTDFAIDGGLVLNTSSTVWNMPWILRNMSITQYSLPDLVFSSTLSAIYVKNFSLSFELVPGYASFNNAYYTPTEFVYRLPNDFDLMVQEQEYAGLRSKFSNDIQKTTFLPSSAIDNVFGFVESFFTTEIFPGFSFQVLLIIALAGLVLGYAIKIFLQG